MTWWILSGIYFSWVFSAVTHLGFIPYSFLTKSFLNALLRGSLPQIYMIIVGLGYLNNQIWYTRFSIIATCLLLYHIISNYTVSGSIIVNSFSMNGSSWLFPLILYRIIRSTKNLSQVMNFACFSGYIVISEVLFLIILIGLTNPIVGTYIIP